MAAAQALDQCRECIAAGQASVLSFDVASCSVLVPQLQKWASLPEDASSLSYCWAGKIPTSPFCSCFLVEAGILTEPYGNLQACVLYAKLAYFVSDGSPTSPINNFTFFGQFVEGLGYKMPHLRSACNASAGVCGYSLGYFGVWDLHNECRNAIDFSSWTRVDTALPF
eukprot:497709-Pelagomonas_calceolata.AAC.1